MQLFLSKTLQINSTYKLFYDKINKFFQRVMVRNIFLAAKAHAIKNHHIIITKPDIQNALNNTTIEDELISSFIYDAFDLELGLPKAQYTQKDIDNVAKSNPLKLENSLKKIFNNLKNITRYDIMNISTLNTIDNLPTRYMLYAQKSCFLIRSANEMISDVLDCNYKYNVHEAMSELGLDEDTVYELLDDYVKQILVTNKEFIDIISYMWEKQFLGEEFSFQPCLNMVHKNLGVAKNLRIADAVLILSEIKKQKDVESISLYLDALVSCAIKLRPKQAVECAIDLDIELHGFKKIKSQKNSFIDMIKRKLT